MFRPLLTQVTARVANVIDEMLLGDFDYIEDSTGLYADVDYYRAHPHRRPIRITHDRRPGCSEPATAAARACTPTR
jgi:hypothetical protein